MKTSDENIYNPTEIIDRDYNEENESNHENNDDSYKDDNNDISNKDNDNNIEFNDKTSRDNDENGDGGVEVGDEEKPKG